MAPPLRHWRLAVVSVDSTTMARWDLLDLVVFTEWMGQFECPHCDFEFAFHKRHCPNCGEWQPGLRRVTAWVALVSLGLFVLILV